VLVAAGADCSVRAVRLQDRAEQALIRPIDCDGAVWSADRTLTASCARDVTTVTAAEPRLMFRFDGCSPAWRPDGAVSFIDDGDLLVARRRGRPQVFVSREELAQRLAGELSKAAEYTLVEAAWRDTQEFAGIVVGRRPGDRALIYYTPDAASVLRNEDLSRVRVSPLGKVAAVRNYGIREFVVVDRSGQDIPLPRVRNARAIAWSEDEEWVAIATREATAIARTGSRSVTQRIPIGGQTLEWLQPQR
jgi:hypothetical protein